MSFGTARTAIKALFSTCWGGTTSPETPWYVENRPASAPAPEFVTVIIQEMTSRTHTNGQQIVERPGVLLVEINVELGKGTDRADDLVEMVRAFFENKRLSTDYVFREVTPTYVGRVNAYYQVVVRVPFVYYHRT